MRTTSGLALYRHQLARFAAVAQTARQMHSQIVYESATDARRLTFGGVGSQGPGRKRWLSKNRPFSRNIARSKLRVTPLPIGVISGQVQRGWRLARGRGAGQTFELRNRARHAKYILFDSGTVKMRGRGFQKEIMKRFRARNKALVDTVRKRQAK